MRAILWQKPPAKLLISRDDFHIWRVDTEDINYPLENFISLLSSEEMKRSERFIFASSREFYQIAHAMKRLILATYLARDPQCLKFEIGNHGKPAIANLQNLLNIQFNISHSRSLILIAITVEDSVGIDIEYQDENIPVESLSENVLSPLEMKFFSALKCPQEKKLAFFRCWTRKEAYLKAIGIGLTQKLTSISVDLKQTTVSLDWLKIATKDRTELIKWKLFPLEMHAFYIASAVATSFQKYLFTYDAKYLSY